MDNTIRLQYLEAMGIDVWIPRLTSDLPSLVNEHPRFGLTLDASIDQWLILQTEVANCTRCELCQTRTQTVFGSGNPRADWMLIGEGPGQHEDLQGLPFVGKAGLLLTEMLRAIGLEREQVFIANVIKCRPPSNRDPKPAEVEACADYLQRQIQFVNPKILLILGRVAAQALFNTKEPIGKQRGRVHSFKGIPAIVIYHPAYLLRTLLDKRVAWEDLKLAMQTYQQIKV